MCTRKEEEERMQGAWEAHQDREVLDWFCFGKGA
jgi:hypothetical protein